MFAYTSNYVLVVEELKAIRGKIHSLRQTPTTSVAERIRTLKKINQLLTESNDLLILRQKLLESPNRIVEK